MLDRGWGTLGRCMATIRGPHPLPSLPAGNDAHDALHNMHLILLRLNASQSLIHSTPKDLWRFPSDSFNQPVEASRPGSEVNLGLSQRTRKSPETTRIASLILVQSGCF